MHILTSTYALTISIKYFLPILKKKKSTLRTRHKMHTHLSLTKNFTAACVVTDGEIRTIRESCILLNCTALMLEELIIHKSTIGSFISLAFSDQTMMYFFLPTDPVTLNFSAACSKHIWITFLYLESHWKKPVRAPICYHGLHNFTRVRRWLHIEFCTKITM